MFAIILTRHVNSQNDNLNQIPTQNYFIDEMNMTLRNSYLTSLILNKDKLTICILCIYCKSTNRNGGGGERRNKGAVLLSLN